MAPITILYVVMAAYIVASVAMRIFKEREIVKKVSISLNIIFVLLIAHYLLLHLSHTDAARIAPFLSSPKIARLIISLIYIFAALASIRAFDHIFFGLYLTKKKSINVPIIFRDIVILLSVVVVILWILSTQYGVKPLTLVTTSAILSAIIGLSLQDVLVNIVSGVAMHTEKPFKEGDFIALDDKIGTVAEMSWRATRIKTIDSSYLIIPNSVIAKSEIKNYSQPTPEIIINVRVGVEYGAPPNKVKQALLECTTGIEWVLHQPPPVVRLVDFGDFAVSYEIFCWITDRSRYAETMDQIRTRMWYNLKRHGISIPFPIREVYTHEVGKDEKREQEEAELKERTRVLRGIDLFKPLSDEEIAELARAGARNYFAAGEPLVKQGEGGESLFLILRGKVSVTIASKEGEARFIANLSQGDFFGEMSLLTGAQRSATVVADIDTEVIEITREHVSAIIFKNTEIV
ncbi:MAG TPA: mechanosensitive ion channel, partial [bacterium]|nr:mechanosensitive ion channel [bacterium]